MNVQRGDVVLVDFPFANARATKVRPAVVIQNDRDNARLLNTILAQITGTTHRALEATQVLVEINSSEGQLSGLKFDSAVNCANLFTADKNRVLRQLGTLAPSLMSKVSAALKTALDIP